MPLPNEPAEIDLASPGSGSITAINENTAGRTRVW